MTFATRSCCLLASPSECWRRPCTALSLEIRAVNATSGADTFAVSGPSGFVGFLDVDRVSHLPLRVRYEQRVQFAVR